MRRTLLYVGLIAVAGLLLALAEQAALELPEAASPPGCFVSGLLLDGDALTDRAGALLHALDGQTTPAILRENLGALLGNPSLKGIDLAAPIRFYYMNPKKYPNPWAYEFHVTDADALKRALLMNSREKNVPPGELQLDRNSATWAADAAVLEALRAWRKGRPPAMEFRVAGQLRARVHLARIVRECPDEFARQFSLMKDRMREALEGRVPAEWARSDIAGSQRALDMAAAALRQVQDVDVGIEMDGGFTRLELDARPLPDSALAWVLQCLPESDASLLNRCPGDASIVLLYDPTLAETGWSPLFRRLGLGMLHLAAPDERLTAFFLSGPDRPIEIVDVGVGDSAVKARRQWEELARGVVSGVPAGLRSLENRAAAPPAMRTAELVPNEAALGPAGLKTFRYFLGANPLAAQEFSDDLTISAIGAAPIARIRQVAALREKDALTSVPAFRKTAASLCQRPSALVYVSPEGIRRWLNLAGLEPAPGVETLGMAAAARLQPAGIHAAFNLPTGAIPESAGP